MDTIKKTHLNKGYVLWLALGFCLTVGLILLAGLFYKGISSDPSIGSFDVILIVLLAIGAPLFFWVGEFALVQPISSYSIEPDGLHLTELSILSGRKHLVAPWWTVEETDGVIFENGSWHSVSIRLNRHGGEPERSAEGRVVHSKEIVRHVVMNRRDWELLKSRLIRR